MWVGKIHAFIESRGNKNLAGIASALTGVFWE